MTFPATGDDEIYSAYQDYQECCGADGDDRYPNYWAYVEDSVTNYEHLERSVDPTLEGAAVELESIQEWLGKLRAEVARHEALTDQLPPMRPQAYDPDDPVDGEVQERPDGFHVTVELWVSADCSDPVGYVRSRVLRDTETTYSDVSILDVWVEEDPD